MSDMCSCSINRRRTYMKVLYFDRGGYCLWCKLTSKGQFYYNSQGVTSKP